MMKNCITNFNCNTLSFVTGIRALFLLLDSFNCDMLALVIGFKSLFTPCFYFKLIEFLSIWLSWKKLTLELGCNCK